MEGLWLAALSGLIGGGTLLVGAAVAWYIDIPQRIVAGIMAVGAGVLISTLAFELVEEAAADGGLVPTTVGFLGGAILYIVADQLISRRSRQRAAGSPQLDASSVTEYSDGDAIPANIVARRAGAQAVSGAGLVIAVGALIDGIPESIVMGLSVLQGGISIPIVAAIAISNFPEGLGSTAALKRGGSSGRYVALLWSGIALITVVASVLGYVAFQSASPNLIALITTIAAGGLLAMVCNTMIPEAFDEQQALTGLWATIGFLGAFLLHELT
ncbi:MULTISPECIES: ZIP family metal transporter [Microbacterium]|jgi:ZIP family zinc transporter|uniref:Zinc transporter ZupT n=1 Tax=Microbacterium trichothecenolyticum TaxID=69370 RepID=A0A0M2HCS5_MICTR|nr:MULTISPECIES: ZIP family zinc transporter [Microbacterium]KJL41992.1 Zinc transporter ZupT [Microbacterium trichothecenolyticum]MDR7190973.1 ZIP family zinc transporter [Microbacterium sp. BE35]